MTNGKKMKQLVAAIERGEGEARKTYWNRIGVAFENRDGSWNLLFDYLPASASVVSPRTFLHRIPGAPGELVNSSTAYAYARALAGSSPRVRVSIVGVTDMPGRRSIAALS